MKPYEWDALEYLKALAEKTGASFRRADDVQKVNEAFIAVAQELRQTYTLGFYVGSGEAKSERKLKIKTKQPKLIVKGRRTHVFKSKEKTTIFNLPRFLTISRKHRTSAKLIKICFSPVPDIFVFD